MTCSPLPHEGETGIKVGKMLHCTFDP